jgi:DNA-binding MarR family transcriptional regulator
LSNYQETPNLSETPNERAVARVLAAFERFQAWIMKVHAPTFIELNLTLAQLRTLYLVAATGPMRMSELATRLGTAPSTASGVVEGLVTLGLLERLEDPADRRQVLVQATSGAGTRLEDFHELSRSRLTTLLQYMSAADDLAAVEHALNLLTDAAGRLNAETPTE